MLISQHLRVDFEMQHYVMIPSYCIYAEIKFISMKKKELGAYK